MKGRPQQKNGFWYVIVPRGKGFSPKWISTGLQVSDVKEKKLIKLIPEIISNHEKKHGPIIQQSNSIAHYATIHSPAPSSTSCINESPLFSAVIDIYLSVADIKDNTRDKYTYAAKHIKKYFNERKMTIAALTTLDLQQYYSSKRTGRKPLSKKTLCDHRTVINQTLKYAIEPLRLITLNPSFGVVLGKPEEPPVQYYDTDMLNELLMRVKYEPQQIATPVIMAAFYGLRRSEVLGLQWSAIDFKNKTIVIQRTAVKTNGGTIYANTTKTKSSYRTMPLFPQVETHLKELLLHQKEMRRKIGKAYENPNEVCTWEDGRLIRPDYVSNRFNKLIEKYELPKLTFHQLRHSTASLLINEGYTLYDIKEWLGHSDIKSTMRYSHLEYKSKLRMADTISNRIALGETALDQTAS